MNSETNRNPIEMFWGEIAPCEHMVQIYRNENAFLDCLEGFIRGGLDSGEAVVVIATPTHLRDLEERLRAKGCDLNCAFKTDQYIALDADGTLAKFMIGDWPHDQLFARTIGGILDRARTGGRRVRAFGEMVALLWDRGHNGATVRLEHLWHSLCDREGFSLFCAYPRSGFTHEPEKSMAEICATHSKVISFPSDCHSHP